MIPFVDDPDFTLYVGDVREVLAGLPDGSVNCCVTSPPYWGLRDYGSGRWEGGDPECDHAVRTDPKIESSTLGGGKATTGHQREGFKGGCPRCGAVRVDQQIGLEPTPDAYVAVMVDVFREVRRVLADDGTLWLNLGDSYAHSLRQSGVAHAGGKQNTNAGSMREGFKPLPSGMKEKDLVGIPWLVALALRADGWYLRSDIIWAKPNPMPESVTDRPTKSHEYVFLLSKSPRYYFDQEAVREPHSPDGRKMTKIASNGAGVTTHENYEHRQGAERWPGAGRNIRTVWEIATQPYAEAHFATFPEELPRRCIAAGCPEWVCATCGKPRVRETEVTYENPGNRSTNGPRSEERKHLEHGTAGFAQRLEKRTETTGWTDCGHNDYRPGVVLDPFMGSGTTALVARKLNRRSIGIELSPEYAALCARRLQQLSLLA